MSLPTVVQSLLKGVSVAHGYGVRFNFDSGPIAVWGGLGNLDATAFSCPVFEGIGSLGRVSAIEVGTTAATEALTFELSSLDTRIHAIANDQADEVMGRRAEVYLYFMDIGATSGNILVHCMKRRTVIMDKMTPKIEMTEDGPLMTISVTSEPVLSRKNRAGNTFLTDADQRARYPGDRIFERAALSERTVVWQ